MQEEKEENIQTKDIEKKQTKRIKLRAILVLAFIILVSIFTYVSYRGTYLETIEIGENFKQVFTRKSNT